MLLQSVGVSFLLFFKNSELSTSCGFIFLHFGIVRDDYFLVHQLKISTFCEGFEGIFGDSVLNAMIGNDEASSTLFEGLRKLLQKS